MAMMMVNGDDDDDDSGDDDAQSALRFFRGLPSAHPARRLAAWLAEGRNPGAEQKTLHSNETACRDWPREGPDGLMSRILIRRLRESALGSD